MAMEAELVTQRGCATGYQIPCVENFGLLCERRCPQAWTCASSHPRRCAGTFIPTEVSTSTRTCYQAPKNFSYESCPKIGITPGSGGLTQGLQCTTASSS